jgi:hypothetical protein
MDKNFIDLATKIVDEKGKNILKDSRLLKGLFLDYSKGQYKAEINLLVKIIELGFYNKIIESDNLNIIKTNLTRQLQKELFIMDEVAFSIVELLISLLRDRNYTKGYNDSIRGNYQKTKEKYLPDSSKTNNKIFYKMKTEVKIYQEPNYNSKIVCRLLIDETIKYLQQERIKGIEWCKVKDSYDNEGWCELNLLK